MRMLLAPALTVVLLSACTGNEAEPTATDPNSTPPTESECLDVEPHAGLSRDQIYDYEPAPTPQDLLTQVPLVVRAQVTRIHELAQRHVVVEFAVSETIQQQSPGLVHEGSVYVIAPRGAEGPEGEPFHAMETFEDALPAGADALLFLGEDAQSSRRTEQRPSVDGVPPDAPLLDVGPQGAAFATCDGVTTLESMALRGWDQYPTLDAMQAALAPIE